MRKQVRKRSLPYEKQLLADVSEHSEKVELALLMYDARHSIRRLERGYESECKCTCWLSPLLYSAQQCLNASHCTADGFARLQHLDLSMCNRSFGEISAVMALSSLKHLGLCNTVPEKSATWDIAPRSSKVQSLEMSYATSSNLMSRLLQSCKTVTEFRCELSGYELDPIAWYSDVIKAAGTHCSTLKRFRLGPNDLHEDEWDEPWRES